MKSFYTFLILFALTPFFSFAQQSFSLQYIKNVNQADSSTVPSFSVNDSLVSVIVRFTIPSEIEQLQHFPISAFNHQAVQQTFLEELHDLRPGTIGIMQSPTFFTKTTQSAVVEIPASLINQVRTFSNVESVYLNQTVTAHDVNAELDMLQVRSFWTSTGLKGNGLRIGVIDSGIDYNHDALGGGFGEGFKVAGGYDFVDNDSDPMDENSHGTHVAGIIGASSNEMQGVAPEATLFALRVLDAKGSGDFARVLAALEWAVDPNNDGDYSDKLDVVNLSLGSNFGDPRDPVSLAVDVASSLGIVCVISAGNSGYSYYEPNDDVSYADLGAQTIGSPGTSREAITVGSLSLEGSLSRFSSKGPLSHIFGVKPDVLAPGENVLSTIPGQAFGAKSGTSMAAPFIAGLAALLKQKHPDWSVQEIKSALVNHSLSKGFKAWQQGAGLAQLQKADSSKLFFSMPHLNFGMNPDSGSTWLKKINFTVRNQSSESQTIAISQSGLKVGIGLSVIPFNFTLEAGAEQEIEVILSVDNQAITKRIDDIRIFDGALTFSTNGKTSGRMPWLFTRSSVLHLRFDSPNPFVIVHDATHYIQSDFSTNYNFYNRLDSLRAQVYGLKPANYNFALAFQDGKSDPAILMYNQVTWNSKLTFSKANATYKISHQLKDPNGKSFRDYDKSVQRLATFFSDAGGFLIATHVNPSEESGIYTNAIPANYPTRFDVFAIDYGDAPVVVHPHFPALSGVQQDIAFTEQDVTWNTNPVLVESIEPLSNYSLLLNFPVMIRSGGVDYKYGNFFDVVPFSSQNKSKKITYISSGNTTGNGVFAAATFSLMKPVTETLYDILIDSDLLTYRDDALVFASPQFYNRPNIRYTNGDTLTLGGGIPFLFNRNFNNVYGEKTVGINPKVREINREQRYDLVSAINYEIKDGNGNSVSKGRIQDRFQAVEVSTASASGELQLQAGYLANEPVIITHFSNYELTKQQVNAPGFYMLRVLDDSGKPQTRFEPGAIPNVEFTVAIPTFSTTEMIKPELTKVEYKPFDASTWTQAEYQFSRLTFTENSDEGYHFTADLSGVSQLEKDAVEIRISVYDSYGNSSVQTIHPAFVVGDWIGGNGSPVEQPEELPKQVELYQNYPNPFNPQTAIHFYIPQSAPVELRVYNVLGQLVDVLLRETRQAGKHSVNFNGIGKSSGVYFYELRIGEQQFIKKMMLIK
ncbi:T9SS type A sorting domain-containing protein [bacterium]|nr:MAG: T9SS type A sorting domain-containing protein [bacterium]